MDFLRKWWPMSFSVQRKDVKPFVIRLIVYAVVVMVFTALSSLITAVLTLVGAPQFLCGAVGALLGLFTGILDLYCTAGIVFCILKFTGVFKDADPAAEPIAVPAEESKTEPESKE